MDENVSKEVKTNGMIQELEMHCNWLRTRCAQLAAELTHALKTVEEHVKKLEELKEIKKEE